MAYYYIIRNNTSVYQSIPKILDSMPNDVTVAPHAIYQIDGEAWDDQTNELKSHFNVEQIVGVPTGDDLNFAFLQNSASAMWTVPHNLGKNPSVTVVDTGGTTLEADVSYVDDDNLTITFLGACSGTAYLN